MKNSLSAVECNFVKSDCLSQAFLMNQSVLEAVAEDRRHHQCFSFKLNFQIWENLISSQACLNICKQLVLLKGCRFKDAD